MDQQIRRILLVMHNWAGNLSGVQQGIAEYLAQRPDWIWARILPRHEHFTQVLSTGNVDGVIAYVEEEYLDDLKQFNVPIVDVSIWWNHPIYPQVLPDDLAIGRMAADYLMDLGVTNLATVGWPDVHFSDLRLQGFIDRAAELGKKVNACPADMLPLPKGISAPPGVNPVIFSWLLTLSRPTAIFCAQDNKAAEVLEICRHAKLNVPEDLCVLGVDNDELVAKLSHPPLSSIALPTEKIGYTAAKLLDDLMNGATPPKEPIRLSPINVVTRQSTNILKIPDEDVQSAVRYIRERVHTRVTVADLLKVVPVNRRYLERKFKEHIGRTPLQEIRRARVEKAKELLSGTDMTIPAVARHSGFASPERFCNVFHTAVGVAPTTYRKKFRLDDVE